MTPPDGADDVRILNLQDAPRLFERLFNAGDVDGIVRLYAPDAVLVHEPGLQAVGPAVREAVAELMRGRRTLTINRRSVQRSGDLVLGLYDWSLTGVERWRCPEHRGPRRDRLPPAAGRRLVDRPGQPPRV
jgi:ketosteroid isomerase-like protein